MLNKINRNKVGAQVNGRAIKPPDVSLYEKLKKKQQANSKSPSRFTSRLSQGRNSNLALDEEETAEAREFTTSMLAKSGSTGGNKSLFVSSKAALGRSSPINIMSASQGGFLSQTDPTATFDYKALKQNQNASRTLANRSSALMDSSISMTRFDREFSPKNKSVPRNVFTIFFSFSMLRRISQIEN